MTWTEQELDGLLVLTLEGEIDLHYSPELRELLQAKAKARCPALVLDFSAVDYIDSSGLATLVEYCREALEFEGQLGIVGLRDRARTIFELSRLNELIHTFPALADASAAFRSKFHRALRVV